MNVTLAQLAAFERIVRLGSFRAAARQLGLTQPSVSQRIRELEATLQVQLFRRHGPNISLTAEGTALVDYADRLLGTADEMVDRFRGRDVLKGVLRLGLNETFGLICLPDLLRRLEERHPLLTTAVQVGDTGTISAQLNAQQLDIAIISEPAPDEHVRHEPLGVNEQAWFAGTALAVPDGRLTPRDLAGFHLMVPPPPARLHATAVRWFAEGDAVPRRLSMCNSLPVTIRTVVSGLAVGLAPVRVMAEELERGTVRRLPVTPEVPGHRVAICYQISEFGPSMQHLVGLLRELVSAYRLFT